MAHKRNIDMHTSADDAKRNILLGLLDSKHGANKSGLGYMAYPDYSFKAPQGAAFAVAKIARQLEDDKLIQTHYTYHGGEYCGYHIRLTAAGMAMAETLKGVPAIPKPECPACGYSDYEGELRQCPHCEGLKCSCCDMGNDVGCAVCDTEE